MDLPEITEDSAQTKKPEEIIRNASNIKERKGKAKSRIPEFTDMPELVISRFFSTPRRFTQDEIITIKPELGDHIVDYIWLI